MPEGEVKSGLLRSVAQRMGRVYGNQIPNGTLRERLEILIRLLGERKIPARVEDSELPVLEVQACPYPDIPEGDGKRGLCELEKQMLSDALGEPMELARCRMDGHACCQFRPANAGQEVSSY